MPQHEIIKTINLVGRNCINTKRDRKKGMEIINWNPLIGIALWALLPGFIAKKKGRNFWGYYFLSFLITPLLTTIITVCLANLSQSKNDKGQVKGKETTVVEPQVVREISDMADGSETIETWGRSPDTQSVSAPRKIRFCRRCGFELIDTSKFCSRCGNEIERVDAQ